MRIFCQPEILIVDFLREKGMLPHQQGEGGCRE
jgi:hypothetical protein